MREYSKILPQFWLGSTGKKLRGHPEAQIVAFYLLTTPHANMIGLYYLPKMFISHETGLPFEGACKGLQRCIEAGFCRYDDENEMVWVIEMAIHQIGELKATDNRCIGIQNEYDKLPESLYFQDFYAKYSSIFHMKKQRGNTSPLQAPSDTLRSQEQEQEQEQDLNKKNNASEDFQKQDESHLYVAPTRRTYALFDEWKPEPELWKETLKRSAHLVKPEQFTNYTLLEFIRLNVGKDEKMESEWQKFYVNAIARGYIKPEGQEAKPTNQPEPAIDYSKPQNLIKPIIYEYDPEERARQSAEMKRIRKEQGR